MLKFLPRPGLKKKVFSVGVAGGYVQIFPGHTYIYVNKSVLAPQAFHMHAAGPVLGILRATGPLQGESTARKTGYNVFFEILL